MTRARDPAAIAVALRELELVVSRRLDGLLHGDHRGLVPGHGSEPGDARRYQPGDDVRRIDWNVTARTREPHVRDAIADRELDAWLLVDLSASLEFGTARRTKRELAESAAAAVAFLAGRGGNRVGAVLAAGGAVQVVPPRAGRAHVLALLHRVLSAEAADGTGPAGLAEALDRLAAVARRRGLAAVVSDWLEGDPAGLLGTAAPPPWAAAVGRLAQRHDVLAVEVLDPRELELPDVGVLELVDPETGRRREVQTADADLRRRYAAAAEARRRGIAAALRAAGADHLVLRTDRDWLGDLVAFVAGRRRRLAALPARAPR